MAENKSMKRKLIMQSFAPLFLILFIQYFDCELLFLPGKLFEDIRNRQWNIIPKVLYHEFFVTYILEFICLVWIIYSAIGVKAFGRLQRANFSSQGETLTNIEKIPDSGVTFFMTYVLPMAMDDLDSPKGIVVFVILMGLLFVLMWKTNLYYQNPVLTILGYEVFSFQFETTQLNGFHGKECIGITRGKVNEGRSIKRQLISDNVFIIYENTN